MLFNSFVFVEFFIVVTVLYFLLPHKFRWFLLLLASCIFYMYYIPGYIKILGTTIVVDYFAGLLISNAKNPRMRKVYLLLSLAANIGFLAYFKYFNFFVENINSVAEAIGWNYSIPLLGIVLPIGLSFHTFQAMSYTIEVYRGNQKPEKHFGIYALYVMYYPQLVAGPIERPQNVLPQFHTPQIFDYSRIINGLKQMLFGFFKKMVIADNIAVLINPVFDDPYHHHAISIFISAILFGIQIYCDFSGYSDIALGASRVMGIELMQNFKAPYLSKSITEFWSRWHISLSTWFRDYLYIPLGGNKVSFQGWMFNIFFVFAVSGFWHGANWTFIVWGALHGFICIFERSFNHFFKFQIKKGWSVVNVLLALKTFLIVSFIWIFFRAENITTAMYMARQFVFAIPEFIINGAGIQDILLQSNQSLVDNLQITRIIVLLMAVFIIFYYDKIDYERNFIEFINHKPFYKRIAFYAVIIYFIILFGVFHSEQEFIYFQF
jgi:alginate O-acetyltransferase complex protein AlgI